jgi:membrane-bound inhibitor of C-type lysozyme
MFSRRLTRPIAIGATALAIGGGAYGIVSAAASTGSGATTAPSSSARSGQRAAADGGSNARSGPAAGGSVGTVSSVSATGFGLLTSAGQKVTVKETADTKYETGTKSASASAVRKGETVLVVGTTDNTTITATQVIVQPTDSGSKTSSKVIPFAPGTPSTAKKVGQIPASYTEGSGTIVGGSSANKATKAALAAYPGGIVDRVVLLSNGEYEVHNIGVSWPHHVFVSKDYKVVGAY